MFTVKIIHKDGRTTLIDYSGFQFIGAESVFFQQAINFMTPDELYPYLLSQDVKHSDRDTFDIYGFVFDKAIGLEFSAPEPIAFGDEVYVTGSTGKTGFSVKAEKVIDTVRGGKDTRTGSVIGAGSI